MQDQLFNIHQGGARLPNPISPRGYLRPTSPAGTEGGGRSAWPDCLAVSLPKVRGIGSPTGSNARVTPPPIHGQAGAGACGGFRHFANTPPQKPHVTFA